MAKRIIQLSDAKVKNAKAQTSEYKLFDGQGLFLLVTPSGGKYWHFKYRFDEKEKGFSFGPYPEISLVEARMRRDEARTQIAHGIDPASVRRQKRYVLRAG